MNSQVAEKIIREHLGIPKQIQSSQELEGTKFKNFLEDQENLLSEQDKAKA